MKIVSFNAVLRVLSIKKKFEKKFQKIASEMKKQIFFGPKPKVVPFGFWGQKIKNFDFWPKMSNFGKI